MRVLGLDIATSTGFGLLDDDSLLAYGLLVIPSKATHRERFKIFRKELIKLYKISKPDLVVIEDTFVKKNVAVTSYLNQLRGIAIESIPVKSDFYSLKTSQARASLGKGKKYTKEDVFNCMVTKYKLKGFVFEEHNDITDAILLAYAATLGVDV